MGESNNGSTQYTNSSFSSTLLFAWVTRKEKDISNYLNNNNMVDLEREKRAYIWREEVSNKQMLLRDQSKDMDMECS